MNIKLKMKVSIKKFYNFYLTLKTSSQGQSMLPSPFFLVTDQLFVWNIFILNLKILNYFSGLIKINHPAYIIYLHTILKSVVIIFY